MRNKIYVALDILLVAIALGMILWSTLVEPAQLFVRNYDITVPRWPAEFNGMKVAIISDLHVGSHFIDNAKVKRVVDEANACQPDLILLLGDYVYTDPSERAKRYGPLQQRITSLIMQDEKKVDSASFIAELALLKARLGECWEITTGILEATSCGDSCSRRVFMCSKIAARLLNLKTNGCELLVSPMHGNAFQTSDRPWLPFQPRSLFCS